MWSKVSLKIFNCVLSHQFLAMATRRLNTSSIFLHWLIFLFFVTALTGIEIREVVPSGDPLRRTLRATHIFTGQLIFFFALLRVFVRLKFPVPPTPHVSRWMVWAALAVHGLMYMVMFAQPMLGVLSMQAGDKTVMFLGSALPKLVASDPELYFTLKDFHKWVGNSFYFLVALHALGALWHHFVLKDDSLRSMLTRRPKD